MSRKNLDFQQNSKAWFSKPQPICADEHFQKKFPEAKIIVWKCSVIERKDRFSGENVFSGLSKAHFKCSVQHFEKKMIKVNFTFCGLFRTVCVFIWSERKVSQGFQNHKLSVQMKKIGRVFLTHMLSENIFSFWAEKLAVLAKNYRHGCQNCNLRTFRKFWGKTVFFKLNMIANFFGLRDEENWDVGQKNFLQSYYNRNSRFQRNVLRKNDFSFERGFIFLLSFLEFEWFLCPFLQNSLVRCVKPPISVLREIKWGNYPGKIVFSINFEFEEKKIGFSAKQWGMVLKTVAHLCSWPFSETFLEAKLFVWKFLVIERKHRISRGNVFSGLSKAHFKCSAQHFEKKMIKVNFKFCGLFRTVCVFFWSERKFSQQFQNH